MSCSSDRFAEVRKHEHIVLCVDRFNPLGVIRSLGEAGIRPIVLMIADDAIPLCCKSRYIKELSVFGSDEEAISYLLSHFQLSPRPFLYVCDDRRCSLLDTYHDKLIDQFYFFHGLREGDLTKLMDKSKQYSIAEECGFNVPSFQVIDKKDEVEDPYLYKFPAFPVITKDLSSIIMGGRWKEDVYLCNSEDDLFLALKKIPSPRIIVQKYVNKINEVSFDGFSIDGGQFVYIPFEISFHRTNPTSYGYYIRVRPFNNMELMNKISAIIKRFHYSGCFDVEALIDSEGVYHFLEVNLRFSCWNYAVTCCSFNYPLEWAKATLDYEKNKQITVDGPILENGGKSGMVEPMDFHNSVLSRRVSLLRWLKELFSADFLFFYNKNDIRPVISYLTAKIHSINVS